MPKPRPVSISQTGGPGTVSPALRDLVAALARQAAREDLAAHLRALAARPVDSDP